MLGDFFTHFAILLEKKLFCGIQLVSGRHVVAVTANFAGESNHDSMFAFFCHKNAIIAYQSSDWNTLGAEDGNRTRGLVLTKNSLYH